MKEFFKSLDKMATEIKISEVMVTEVLTLNQESTVQKAVDLMALHSISGLIVCDDKDYPVGIVSEGDMLKQVFHKKKNPAKVKIKEVMSKKLTTISPELSIGETSVLMKRKSISKLPVVKNRKIIGYVTKSDLLEKLNEIYHQNRRLLWLTAFVVFQFIVTQSSKRVRGLLPRRAQGQCPSFIDQQARIDV